LSSGHDRSAAIRNLSVLSRINSISREIAVRHHLGFIARNFWSFGRVFVPLLSYFDGTTSRLFVQMKKKLSVNEKQYLGFLAHCKECGYQLSQPLYSLSEWNSCNCARRTSPLKINGPLWLGYLHSKHTLDKLEKLLGIKPNPISKDTSNLINKLMSDESYPPFCWKTSELSSRFSLKSTPSMESLIKHLKENGCMACRNALVPSGVRTDATISHLFSLCEQYYS